MAELDPFHYIHETLEYDIVDNNGVWTFNSDTAHLFFFDNSDRDFSEQEHIFEEEVSAEGLVTFRYIFNTDGILKPHMDAMMEMGFDYTISRYPSDEDWQAWLDIQKQDIEELRPEDFS